MTRAIAFVCVSFLLCIAQISPLAPCLRAEVDRRPVDLAGFTRPVRVACVGDDTTWKCFRSPGEEYPAKLQEMLGNKWKVGNLGIHNGTVINQTLRAYAKNDWFPRVPAFEPDVVVILLGGNDARKDNWVHKADFVKDYTALVEKLRALPSKPRVFICRTLPVFTRDPQNQTDVDAQREQLPLLDKLAVDLGTGLIDTYTPFLGEETAKADAQGATRLFIGDGSNVTAEGAKILATEVYAALVGKPAPDIASLTRVCPLFLDNAVLPRDVTLPVWGTAPPGQSVTVEFAGQKVAAVTDKDGCWEAKLDPLKASNKPAVLTITGNGEPIVVPGVLVGDVFLLAADENTAPPYPSRAAMPRRLQAKAGGTTPIPGDISKRDSEPVRIRSFNVKREFMDKPARAVMGEWNVTGQSEPVLAYLFANELLQTTGVPVGLILTGESGGGAGRWISKESISKPGNDRLGDDIMAQVYVGSNLYNARIAALPPFPIKGVIWSHGSQSGLDTKIYEQQLLVLMEDWRVKWNRPDLPFLVLQIPPAFPSPTSPTSSRMSATPELRTAQAVR